MIQVEYSSQAPSASESSGANSNIISPQMNRFQPPQFRFRMPFRPQHNNQLLNSLPDDFDGKRLRKSNMRKTVDYNCSVARMLQNRVWQRDYRDRHSLQPDQLYIPDLLPPKAYLDNPINAVTTRFVKTATNKMRCPIFCMAWTPEGRRLVTGASSGEFTLWNGLTFNFETILQAHDSPVRSMVWSHNDGWMLTGDHAGYCKYWQSNMNNVRMFQAHKEAIRGLSFSPTDQKIVSCSDDGTLRIWDFQTCQEERVLRGHGADVKCCGWHPHRGLIASGSKDNQQPIKLWDPKTGNSLTTLHAHKATVMDLKWNKNGNWFITASRDHFLKLFDIRSLGQPVQTFRGHKKEASCVAWHPVHEGLLASGGSDGAILFWHVGADKEVGSIESAHDSIVWTLDWHPLGHILASGSNDHSSKFWTRNRPGDKMRDRYNLNLGAPNSLNDDGDIPEESIPGMAPEDRVESDSDPSVFAFTSNEAKIPGLEETETVASFRKEQTKKPQKLPITKQIPKNFVASWNDSVESAVDIQSEQTNDDEEEIEGYGTESVLAPILQLWNKTIEMHPEVKRAEELEPDAIIAFGRVLPVPRGSKLFRAVRRGCDRLQRYLTSGKVRELKDLPGFKELEELYESGSDSSMDDDSVGTAPNLEELKIDELNLDEYLKPFTGFKEVDLDDVPYRDKDTIEPSRSSSRKEDRRDDDRRDDGRRQDRKEREGSRDDHGRNQDRDYRDQDRDYRDQDRDYRDQDRAFRDRFEDKPSNRMGPGFGQPSPWATAPLAPNNMLGPAFMQAPSLLGPNLNLMGMGNLGMNYQGNFNPLGGFMNPMVQNGSFGSQRNEDRKRPYDDGDGDDWRRNEGYRGRSGRGQRRGSGRGSRRGSWNR